MRRFWIAILVLLLALPCGATTYVYCAAPAGADGYDSKQTVVLTGDVTDLTFVPESGALTVDATVYAEVTADATNGDVLYLVKDGDVNTFAWGMVTVKSGGNTLTLTNVGGAAFTSVGVTVDLPSTGPAPDIGEIVEDLNDSAAGYADGSDLDVYMRPGTYTETGNATVYFDHNDKTAGYDWTINKGRGAVTLTMTNTFFILYTYDDDYDGSILWQSMTINNAAPATIHSTFYTYVTNKSSLAFDTCTVNVTGSGEVVFRWNSTTGTTAITATDSTFTSDESIATIEGSISLTDTGGTYTSAGEFSTLVLSGTGRFKGTNTTISNTSEGHTTYAAGGKYCINVAGGTPYLDLTDCTVQSDPDGWVGGISVLYAAVLCRIKGTDITTPLYGLNLGANLINADIDGTKTDGTRAAVTVDSPYYFHVYNDGTAWDTGNTITIYIQRGLDYSYHTFTVTSNVTPAQICSELAADWNANADTYCKTVTASAITGDYIRFTATTPGNTFYSMDAVENSTHGAIANKASTGFVAATGHTNDPLLPGEPLIINCKGSWIRNYRVKAYDAQPWECARVTPDTYAGTLIENCDFRGARFALNFRGIGAVIQRCTMYGSFGVLFETAAHSNTINHCSIYTYPDSSSQSGGGSGGVVWDDAGGDAHDNTIRNSIIVANGALVKQGTGASATWPIYCVSDYDDNGPYDMRLDYNWYYASGGSAKYLRLSPSEGGGTAEYSTFATMQAAWRGVLSWISASYDNDLHSVTGNPSLRQIADATSAGYMSPGSAVGRKRGSSSGMDIGAVQTASGSWFYINPPVR